MDDLASILSIRGITVLHGSDYVASSHFYDKREPSPIIDGSQHISGFLPWLAIKYADDDDQPPKRKTWDSVIVLRCPEGR